MRRIILAVLMVMGLALTGCSGSEKALVAQQTQAAAAVKKEFYMDVPGKMQRYVIPLENGNITHLQGIGTMKYLPKNVVSIMYVSERQYFEVLPTVDAAGESIAMEFHGVINNDRPQTIFLMDDGEQYPVDQPSLPFNSNGQIRYEATTWGFEYGHQEKTYVDIKKNSDNTVTFNVFFGCNKLVGLLMDLFVQSVGGIGWELEDGTLYTGTISTNSYGSFEASVPNVPLVQKDVNTYWHGPSTLGRLVVFSKSGLRVPFSTWRTGYGWDYGYKYPELQYENPYWDVPGKESFIDVYIPLNY